MNDLQGLASLREAYRLRRDRRVGPGGHELRLAAGDDRLFDTWREAIGAADDVRGRVATQAVMLDADGRVVFPIEDRRMLTRGRWLAGIQVQVPPAGTRNCRPPRPARRRADTAKAPPAAKPPGGAGDARRCRLRSRNGSRRSAEAIRRSAAVG